MKKIRNFLLLCLVTIIATGCVKFNATIDIKKDKSMDFTVIYALDKSMLGDMASLKEEDFTDLKKDGYSIEKYSEGNLEGFKITRSIKNIDEVSTDKDVIFNLSGMLEEDNEYMFKVVKDGDKGTYYAKFIFDSNDSGLNGMDEEDEELPDEDDNLLTITEADDLTTITEDEDEDTSMVTSDSDFDISKLMEGLDLSVHVNLPNSAISSNATTKENNDKNLTWKLGYSKAETIEFVFELDPNAASNNILLYVGIGAGVLVLAAIVFVIVNSSKKKKSTPVVNEVKVEKEENKE